MPEVLWVLVTTALMVISHLVLQSAAAGDVSGMAPSPLPHPRPRCPTMCGTVEIPYPFGVNETDCALLGLDDFVIYCNDTFNPPRPYIGNIEISRISLETGEMFVSSPVSVICYTSASTTDPSVGIWWSFNITGRPSFLISPTQNIFTAIGCNTLALLKGREDWSYYTGCITFCESIDEAAHDGDNCTGLGCCQTAIPGNLNLIAMPWNYDANRTNPAWKYSPCSYAFVAQKDWYNFSRQDLVRDGNETFASRVGERNITMVLDWAIRVGGSCSEGREVAASVCKSANSQCVNAKHGAGYLCNCSDGYMGNPYVTDGCKNINECELGKSNPCVSGSTCHDMPGGYKCKCKLGYIGDGKTDCRDIIPYAIAIAAIFVSIVVACFATVSLKRRKQRDRFSKHGGDLLKDVGINIFSEVELKKITNGYKNAIGEGAFGKVYMGTIDGAQHVAVKCSNAKGQALPQEEFRNEIIFQFRISHRNVVRLVGCCLETDVPMLVFEFVPNGSLYSVLHDTNKQTHTLPLLKRLDIAVGSAEALAHMHSHVGHNHVHGDVKSGNILLDGELMPKVSDFGSSKLLTIGYTRSVSADMNYIDPVCMKTGRLTEKSDVYSFGVVLLELVTRKTAKYDTDKSLPIDFVKFCKEEGNGRAMYDRDILTTDDDAQAHAYLMCLDKIGALAVLCLKEDVDERPTMAEVVVELKQAKIIGFGGPCSEAT